MGMGMYDVFVQIRYTKYNTIDTPEIITKMTDAPTIVTTIFLDNNSYDCDINDNSS